MSRELIITDLELEGVFALSPAARDARIARHAENLRARGVTPRVPADALAVLARNDNRYTWTGDVRG